MESSHDASEMGFTLLRTFAYVEREDKGQMVTGGPGVRPDSGGFTGGSVEGPSPSNFSGTRTGPR
jgi:hypothetical protein